MTRIGPVIVACLVGVTGCTESVDVLEGLVAADAPRLVGEVVGGGPGSSLRAAIVWYSDDDTIADELGGESAALDEVARTPFSLDLMEPAEGVLDGAPFPLGPSTPRVGYGLIVALGPTAAGASPLSGIVGGSTDHAVLYAEDDFAGNGHLANVFHAPLARGFHLLRAVRGTQTCLGIGSQTGCYPFRLEPADPDEHVEIALGTRATFGLPAF